MFDIIIVTYNAKDRLRQCINSVRKFTKGHDYQITVIDNGSRDGTRRFLRLQKDLNVIYNKSNLGLSKALNLAIKRTENDFIVRLDDDMRVTKGWLMELYQQIKDNPKAGIVGCKVVLPNNRIFSADYWPRSLHAVVSGEIDRGQRDYIRECDVLNGACYLMRRELIQTVGYFYEGFFPCRAEDLDYCYRTRLAGYRIIYNGKVKAIHPLFARKRKEFMKNMQKFLKRWGKAFQKFPLKDSHPVDRYMADGIDYLLKRRFSQALTEFKKAESFDKRFLNPLYIYMGIASEGIGQYHNAVKYFKNAIMHFEKVSSITYFRALPHFRLAFLYKNMGLVKVAQKEVRTALNYLHSYKPSWLKTHYTASPAYFLYDKNYTLEN